MKGLSGWNPTVNQGASIPCKRDQKRAEVAILISDKIAFKAKNVI